MSKRRLLIQHLMTLSMGFGLLCGCSAKNAEVGVSVKAEESGSSTNVGSGGIGASATWNHIAQRIKSDLNRLAFASIDEKLFERIQKELPVLIDQAKIEFVDYPLILGEETCKTASHWSASQTKVSSNERDAINFSECVLIKVNLRRFSVYDAAADEVQRLVLHEYLGLMGIAEIDGEGATTYQTTNAILEAFKKIANFESGFEVKMITTCEDMESMQDPHFGGSDENRTLMYPSVIYRLAKDLDCSQHVPKRQIAIHITYRVLVGHFDGDGHTLIPPPLPPEEDRERKPEFEYYGPALFDMVCARCTIANLKIKNAKVYGAALLVGNNFGNLVNLSVQGVLKFRPHVRGEKKSKFGHAGGVVAFNERFISNLKADIRIESDDSVN